MAHVPIRHRIFYIASIPFVAHKSTDLAIEHVFLVVHDALEKMHWVPYSVGILVVTSIIGSAWAWKQKRSKSKQQSTQLETDSSSSDPYHPE